MRQTALELVNDILEAGDQDSVFTISESEEAQQALSILNRAYLKLIHDIDWVHRRILARLSTATGTTTTWNLDTYPDLPWVMKIPNDVESIYQVYYDVKRMIYNTPEVFQHLIIERNRDDVTRGFRTDRRPLIYTSFDDQFLTFDAFDSTVETQLSSVRAEVLVTKFTGTDLTNDTDILDLPNRFYDALIEKAMQWYFEELVGNIAIADRKRLEYIDSLGKLKKWGRRNKPKLPYFRNVDYSRRLPASRTIRKEITEITV